MVLITQCADADHECSVRRVFNAEHPLIAIVTDKVALLGCLLRYFAPFDDRPTTRLAVLHIFSVDQSMESLYWRQRLRSQSCYSRRRWTVHLNLHLDRMEQIQLPLLSTMLLKQLQESRPDQELPGTLV